MSTSEDRIRRFKERLGEEIKPITALPWSERFKKITKLALLKEIATTPEYQKLKQDFSNEKKIERARIKQEEDKKLNAKIKRDERRENLLQKIRQNTSIPTELSIKEKQLQLFKKLKIKDAFKLWKLMNLKLEKDIFMELLEEGSLSKRLEFQYTDTAVGYRTNEVADHIKEVKILDKEIALKLIQKGLAKYLFWNIDIFTWLDQELAVALIRSGRWDSVADNLEKFEWIDYKNIADLLMSKWLWWTITKNLWKFKWIDHQWLADKLIEDEKSGWYYDEYGYLRNKTSAVLYDRGNFVWVDLIETVRKLIKKGKLSSVQQYLEKCEEWALDIDIAVALIKDWVGWSVKHYLSKFKWLNEEIYQKLSKK